MPIVKDGTPIDENERARRDARPIADAIERMIGSMADTEFKKVPSIPFQIVVRRTSRRSMVLKCSASEYQGKVFTAVIFSLRHIGYTVIPVKKWPKSLRSKHNKKG